VLTVILSAAFILPFEVVSAQSDYYSKEFEWNYDNRQWTWRLDIPKALYDAYKSVPVSTRTRNGLEGYGYLTTTNDPYLRSLAQKLNETSKQMGYDSYDEVSFVLAFVQSLPYTSDSATSGHDEYPRFPIETIVDDGGDCEDTSILFATITLIMNYGTIYINPPNHYAVGILGEKIPGGYYWTVNDQKYYFCETTGNGFKIGDLPDEYQNKTAYTYPIQESQQYIPDIQIVEPGQSNPSTAPNSTPTQKPTQIPNSTDNPFDTSTSSIFDDSTMVIILAAVVIAICIAVISTKSLQKVRRTETQPPVPQAPLNSQEQGRYCVYCGSLNSSQAVFCNKCGQKME
jgi:hypothetical protein